jgi:hypothetical protein
VPGNERKTNLNSQLIQEANREVEKEIEETKKSLQHISGTQIQCNLKECRKTLEG